jgi:hypothetical protein
MKLLVRFGQFPGPPAGDVAVRWARIDTVEGYGLAAEYHAVGITVHIMPS